MNAYEVLKLNTECTYEQIRESYRKLANETHPDKCKEEGAKEKFQKVSQAYTLLRDPVTRTEHDRYHGLTVDISASEDKGVKCTIKVNKYSLTLDISEELVAVWLDTCKKFYTDATVTDREIHGVQVKTPYQTNIGEETREERLGSISITLCSTTAKILVQGPSYLLWLEEHYPRLQAQVKATTKSLGKSLQESNSRRTSSRPRKQKTLMSGQRCGVCDHHVTELSQSAAWDCQLCNNNFHRECATPSPKDENMCRNCCPPSDTEEDSDSVTSNQESGKGDDSETSLTPCTTRTATATAGPILLATPGTPEQQTSNSTGQTENGKPPTKAAKKKKAGKTVLHTITTKAKKRDLATQKESVLIANVTVLQRTVHQLENKYVELLNEVHALKSQTAETSLNNQESQRASVATASVSTTDHSVVNKIKTREISTQTDTLRLNNCGTQTLATQTRSKSQFATQTTEPLAHSVETAVSEKLSDLKQNKNDTRKLPKSVDDDVQVTHSVPVHNRFTPILRQHTKKSPRIVIRDQQHLGATSQVNPLDTFAVTKTTTRAGATYQANNRQVLTS